MSPIKKESKRAEPPPASFFKCRDWFKAQDVTVEFISELKNGDLAVRIKIPDMPEESFLATQRPDGGFDLQALPEYLNPTLPSAKKAKPDEGANEWSDKGADKEPPASSDEIYRAQEYGDTHETVEVNLAKDPKQSKQLEQERVKKGLSLEQFQEISREDAEKWLRGRGFADILVQIAIARIFDKKSFATCAKELNMSNSWVGQQVGPRSSLRRDIETIKSYIRKGHSLLAVDSPEVVLQVPPGLSLVQIDLIVAHPSKLPQPNLAHLRRIADACRMGRIAPSVVLETIRAYPAWLLEPTGRPLLMALVDLLEAMNYGESQRRIPGVVSSGKPRPVAAAAYDALQILTKAKRGGAFNFSDNQLTSILKLYFNRIKVLQGLWGTTGQNATLSIDRRLEIFTKSLPNEFGTTGNQGILSVLQGDTLLEAAHLASRTTGIRPETFVKAYPHPRISAQP